jgi:hypothetical protein
MGRKPKGDKVTNLSGRMIEHLLWGWCLAVCPGPDIHFPFDSEEHRRAMWFEHREYLMSLAGAGRIPGVFGPEPLKKGEKPQAFRDYEGI